MNLILILIAMSSYDDFRQQNYELSQTLKLIVFVISILSVYIGFIRALRLGRLFYKYTLQQTILQLNESYFEYVLNKEKICGYNDHLISGCSKNGKVEIINSNDLLNKIRYYELSIYNYISQNQLGNIIWSNGYIEILQIVNQNYSFAIKYRNIIKK